MREDAPSVRPRSWGIDFVRSASAGVDASSSLVASFSEAYAKAGTEGFRRGAKRIRLPIREKKPRMETQRAAAFASAAAASSRSPSKIRANCAAIAISTRLLFRLLPAAATVWAEVLLSLCCWRWRLSLLISLVSEVSGDGSG